MPSHLCFLCDLRNCKMREVNDLSLFSVEQVVPSAYAEIGVGKPVGAVILHLFVWKYAQRWFKMSAC